MRDYVRKFYVSGEKHLLEWQVNPTSPLETVVITDAVWELIENGAVVKSGKAKADGQNVSLLFEAENEGSFVLRLFVTVPPETVETEILIDVTG